jgi:H+/Cl- antiporter ClcA
MELKFHYEADAFLLAYFFLAKNFLFYIFILFTVELFTGYYTILINTHAKWNPNIMTDNRARPSLSSLHSACTQQSCIQFSKLALHSNVIYFKSLKTFTVFETTCLKTQFAR